MDSSPVEKKKAELMDMVVDSDSHTHKGELCKHGDTIKVTPKVAEMLKKASGLKKDKKV